ncbi:MAG: ABC transporter ATP-binding protein [Candidatus Bathyarchaeota archaeon]|nr:ABC transporter ATP-binding protein [Candidatus Bathyarchaeota archaeon]
MLYSFEQIFPQYMGVAFLLAQAGLILFSAVGLFRSKKTAYYSALIVAVVSVALGGAAGIIYYTSGSLSLNSTITSLSSMLIGALLAVCIFIVEPPKSKMTAITTESNSPYAIQTINASKDYILGANTVPAVKNIDLTIQKGEFVAIMGPSGSGKSTLLNLLGALDKPTSGQILIDGVDISALNQDELAKLRNEKLGFIFQAYNLIARSSVIRNLELPALVKGYSKEERAKKISALLETVHLSNKIAVKPKTLSGGEQQRIAICRALINEPEIILADEPTGNLDSKTGHEIMAFLRNLNSEKQTTIVVVTHDLEVAKKTDKIIYFRDGRILKEEQTGVEVFA